MQNKMDNFRKNTEFSVRLLPN